MKKNPTERKDWCKLPYSVILDERLTAADALVYAVLLDVSDEGVVMRTIAGISELTGISPSQIKRIVNHLQKAGYIISKKTDGRKLILEIKPVIEEQEKKPKQKPSEQEPIEKPEHVEEALMSILAKKLNSEDPQYVNNVYNNLKTQAEARVTDKTKILAYLSTMISNYQNKPDNSDGFVADKYAVCVNNFD